MKYFIDTEFLEGTQKENFPISLFRKNTPNTIDLISIGIVAEDGREYYAISKDFNLKEAWNRYDLVESSPAKKSMGFYKEQVYWIRKNVLRPIHNELAEKEEIWCHGEDGFFTYHSLKRLLNKYGKTNKQIAQEVTEWISSHKTIGENNFMYPVDDHNKTIPCGKPEFYAYFADYDWVAFCWLFGKMIDLPKGFPMYCRDLKQMLDTTQENKFGIGRNKSGKLYNDIKKLPLYPKQTNEHNALADAKWNKELYDFLKSLS